ncbi:DUF883 family protein [Alkalilimnicola sp. S0819]|uniref:DUF883 family protein n=1 Tax=Alkalilimnicola sp. S0819 TaxID=2613922 RepID=UPI001869F33F|nr:DUF883 family protein [Alkalilimnicola sp. S0819]
MRTNMRSNADPLADKVVAELRSLVADAEDLLRPAGAHARRRADAVRWRLKGRLSDAMSKAAAIEDRAATRARHAASSTDRYVRRNPWQTVLIAGAVAFLLGLLFGRR